MSHVGVNPFNPAPLQSLALKTASVGVNGFRNDNHTFQIMLPVT